MFGLSLFAKVRNPRKMLAFKRFGKTSGLEKGSAFRFSAKWASLSPGVNFLIFFCTRSLKMIEDEDYTFFPA